MADSQYANPPADAKVEKIQTKVEADTEAADNASNFSVDYVINYSVPVKERDEAEAAFVQLITALAKAGFATEVRQGASKASLLVFVKISDANLLRTQIYRARMQDWLYGIRTKAPPSGKSAAGAASIAKHFEDEPITEAERLRLAYLLITRSPKEGGAGITPPISASIAGSGDGQDQWKYVVGIFPLHDRAFNRAWIKKWSTKYMLDSEDLDSIRNKFGERVAFYFAFLQNYFKFLVFPAAFGFGAWLFIGQFSWIYAVVNCLWSVIFFEYWKKKEVDLAVQWGTRGVSQIQMPRSNFKYERESQDPVTGETIKVYSPFRRLAHQLLQIPFAIACVLALGGLIAFGFSIEIFINEVYNGPFKQYLTFIPTILLTVTMPILTGILTTVAEKLTVLENYDTEDTHSSMFVQKIFVINFLTSYMPIFLTAFVYVPFGKVIVPHLSLFQNIAARFAPAPSVDGDVVAEKVSEHVAFQINPGRLTKQVIYFTVTAQVVNFLTEVIVPFVKRKVFKAVKDVQEKKAGIQQKDAPEETDFLERVRTEAGLDVYDVTIDYREMVVQFGYLSLFSVVWPLTAVSFLINNWVEARSDAMKIATGSQRPIPWRADSIGPWLSSLGFLSWLGSITSTAVVYLFSADPHGPDGSPWDIKAWALLLSILLAEHLYLLVQLVVRYVIDKMDSPGLQKERAERFALRKQTLADSLGDSEAANAMSAGVSAVLGSRTGEASTEGEGSAEDKFWLRQRGADASIEAGRTLIAEAEEKKGDKDDEKTPARPQASPQEL